MSCCIDYCGYVQDGTLSHSKQQDFSTRYYPSNLSIKIRSRFAETSNIFSEPDCVHRLKECNTNAKRLAIRVVQKRIHDSQVLQASQGFEPKKISSFS
jgi:hypothetical protein